MPRFTRTALSAFLLAASVLAVGCGEQAPTGTSSAQLTISGVSTTSFVVSPNGNTTTANIGDHKIKFDANAICDPTLSSYGTTEWDKPCTVAKTDVKITATYWIDAAGRPQVDFQPALRFNPNSKVTLYLMDREQSASSKDQIFFVNSLGQLVDEAATDPSVATQVGSNGYLYRRIKHFSGYTISTGRSAGSAQY